MKNFIGILRGSGYGAILADPPWRFQSRTGRTSPDYRYPTMRLSEIKELPVESYARDKSHLYLWCPNAFVAEALDVMATWGFTYKTIITWLKIRKDGAPDGSGLGSYFRGATEQILFGTRGRLLTRQAGRQQMNVIMARKQQHSRKPSELYRLIERCSPGPYLELFARRTPTKWTRWGNEA